MAVITEITQGTLKSGGGRWFGYDGITITLSDGDTWEFGISNDRSCCEIWGYIELPAETTDYYIGSDFIGIDLRDESGHGSYDDVSDVYFADVKTSLGVLSFNVYNYHNGYYGHAVSLFHNGEYVRVGE